MSRRRLILWKSNLAASFNCGPRNFEREREHAQRPIEYEPEVLNGAQYKISNNYSKINYENASIKINEIFPKGENDLSLGLMEKGLVSCF